MYTESIKGTKSICVLKNIIPTEPLKYTVELMHATVEISIQYGFELSIP